MLMYLFINGSPTMPAHSDPGFFSSAIYTSIITTGSPADQSGLAEAGELRPDLRHHRHHADLCGDGPIVATAVRWRRCTANGLYAMVFHHVLHHGLCNSPPPA